MTNQFVTEQFFSNYRFFIPMLVQRLVPNDSKKSAKLSSKIIQAIEKLDGDDVKKKIAPYVPQIIEMFNEGKHRELVELIGDVLELDLSDITNEFESSHLGNHAPKFTKKKIVI